MENLTFSNQDVQITSVYFQKGGNEVRFQAFPRQLTYQGRKYVLAES